MQTTKEGGGGINSVFYERISERVWREGGERGEEIRVLRRKR